MPKALTKRASSVCCFVEQHAELFARQGSVQVTWRYHRGQRLGPYYALLGARPDGSGGCTSGLTSPWQTQSGPCWRICRGPVAERVP